MAIKDALLREIEQEAALTRKYLERLPEDRLDWRPHQKSNTLRWLASHLADLPAWSEMVLTRDEFDIAPKDSEPYRTQQRASRAEVLEVFDRNVAKMRELVAATSDEGFGETWTLKAGGENVFSAPRAGVLRSTVISHSIHHRGQLSLYLRLNDVPLPASYGPSADEQL